MQTHSSGLSSYFSSRFLISPLPTALAIGSRNRCKLITPVMGFFFFFQKKRSRSVSKGVRRPWSQSRLLSQSAPSGRCRGGGGRRPPCGHTAPCRALCFPGRCLCPILSCRLSTWPRAEADKDAEAESPTVLKRNLQRKTKWRESMPANQREIT